ncbi:MAG: CBS domain-containing protein [Leptospirillia bacterium]
MNVDVIMTTGVCSVGMDDTVIAVRELLDSKPFHHLLVMDEGRLVGILSDRDVLRATSPFFGTRDENVRDESLMHRRVHQIMTRNPRTIPPDTPLRAAGEIMVTHRISCLPVVSDDDGIHTLEGLITSRDLLQYYLDGF